MGKRMSENQKNTPPPATKGAVTRCKSTGCGTSRKEPCAGFVPRLRITCKSMCFGIIHYCFNVKSRLFFIFCTAGAKYEKRPNSMLGR